jgi:hypothetical protein
VYPAKEDLRNVRAFSGWAEAVPERVFRNARPVKLDRGALIIHVSTTAWANELTLLAPDLLARLHRRAPESGVKVLRFRVGPLPDLPRRRRRKVDPDVPVDWSALEAPLARALTEVHDDALRDASARAATARLRRQDGEDE